MSQSDGMTLDERLADLHTFGNESYAACLTALRALAAYYAEPTEDAKDPAQILAELEAALQ